MAGRIQYFGGELFYRVQYGSMRGQSAVDVLYQWVRKVRECIDGGGTEEWGFWYMKGGFQNEIGDEMLERLARVNDTGAFVAW